VKHKLTPEDHVRTIGAFSNYITQRHKLKRDFAVFSVDSSDPKKLRVLKDDQSLSEGETYYVIENAKLEKVSQKIERKAKKGTSLFHFNSTLLQCFFIFGNLLFQPNSEEN
jgi:hypothetical protein